MALLTRDSANRVEDGVSPGHGQADGQESLITADFQSAHMPLNRGFVEPMTGIEPAYSAWEADVLPLNYIGAVASKG
jgi:hypothetical protein